MVEVVVYFLDFNLPNSALTMRAFCCFRRISCIINSFNKNLNKYKINLVTLEIAQVGAACLLGHASGQFRAGPGGVDAGGGPCLFLI